MHRLAANHLFGEGAIVIAKNQAVLIGFNKVKAPLDTALQIDQHSSDLVAVQALDTQRLPVHAVHLAAHHLPHHRDEVRGISLANDVVEHIRQLPHQSAQEHVALERDICIDDTGRRFGNNLLHWHLRRWAAVATVANATAPAIGHMADYGSRLTRLRCTGRSRKDGGEGRNRTGVHGFAGRCITTLPPRRGLTTQHRAAQQQLKNEKGKRGFPFYGRPRNRRPEKLERETSLELATSTLARLRSTN